MKQRYIAHYRFTRFPYSERASFFYLDAHTAEGASQLVKEYLDACMFDSYSVTSVQAVN